NNEPDSAFELSTIAMCSAVASNRIQTHPSLFLILFDSHLKIIRTSTVLFVHGKIFQKHHVITRSQKFCEDLMRDILLFPSFQEENPVHCSTSVELNRNEQLFFQ
ncbi:unnamed protein product, partial [Amoebophrya sp. A25]